MTKQKEPITQNIRNRREHGSRFKVMFYVIGFKNSKSGSASYSSRQQNQRHGGAVRHFRCTNTVSDKSDSHKICLNILIQFLCVDKLPRHHYTNSDTDCQCLAIGTVIGRFLLSKISVELKRDLHPIGAQVPLAIFGYSSMTSNITRAPSLKLFWKIRQSVMV